MYSNIYEFEYKYPVVSMSTTYVDPNMFVGDTKIYDIDNLMKLTSDWSQLVRVDVYEIPNLEEETVREIRLRTSGYKYINVLAPEHDAPKLDGSTWMIKNLMHREMVRVVAIPVDNDEEPRFKIDFDGKAVKVKKPSEVLASSGHFGTLALLNPQGFNVVVGATLLILIFHAIYLTTRIVIAIRGRPAGGPPSPGSGP
jgi:hypothetical protein